MKRTTGQKIRQSQSDNYSESTVFGFRTSSAVLFLALSIVCAIAVVLPIYAQGKLTAPMMSLSFASLSIGIFVALLCLYKATMRLEDFYRAPHKDPDSVICVRKIFLISFLLIEAAFLFALLSNYPGLCSPDSNTIIDQVTGQATYNETNRYDSLSNAHPVFYTFCLWLVFKVTSVFGSESFSLFVFMFFQITFVACSLAWAVAWLGRTGAKKGYIAIALCFIVLNPVIACHVIILWKDIPFAATLLALVLYLAELDNKHKPSLKQIIVLGVLLLMVSLLRNNGYYVALLTVLYLVIFRIDLRKIATCIAICLVAFMSALHGPVFNALSISQGHFAESAGIPIQQLAATVKAGGSISPEDQAILDEILPLELWAECYDPSTSNPIKQHDSFDDEFLNTHKKEFLRVWANCLPGNITTYIKAWVLETYGYWQPGYTTYLGKLTCTADGQPVTDFFGLSYKPQVIANELRNLFPIVFGMGSLIWFSLITMIMGIASGRGRRHIAIAITPYIPLLGLIGTLLIAAPIVSDYRYIFALYLVLPFLPQILALCRDRQKTED